MSQSSGGIGQVLGIAALGAAAWFVYENFFAAPAATTPAPGTTGTTTTPPATVTPPVQTSTVMIPAGFSVVPDVNNSYTGYVTLNGTPNTKLSLIFSGLTPTGQVFNANGQDITASLGGGNIGTLVSAFQNAAENYATAQAGMAAAQTAAQAASNLAWANSPAGQTFLSSIPKIPGMAGLGAARGAVRIPVPRLVVRRRMEAA